MKNLATAQLHELWFSLDAVLLGHYYRKRGKQEFKVDSKLTISFLIRGKKSTIF